MRFSLVIALMLSVCGPAAAKPFSVASPDIVNGAPAASMVLAHGYGLGCDGSNRAPALTWSDVPAGTLSFLVTLYDKDAPTDVGFMHWVVANVPGNATGLSESELPSGALEPRTDMGTPGYVGICPPVGSTHAYLLTVKALNISHLPVDASTTPALVGFLAHEHIIGIATLRFNYGR
jgi:Raf kinase inhibitor-like YbhB/YbcL family protein